MNLGYMYQCTLIQNIPALALKYACTTAHRLIFIVLKCSNMNGKFFEGTFEWSQCFLIPCGTLLLSKLDMDARNQSSPADKQLEWGDLIYWWNPCEVHEFCLYMACSQKAMPFIAYVLESDLEASPMSFAFHAVASLNRMYKELNTICLQCLFCWPYVSTCWANCSLSGFRLHRIVATGGKKRKSWSFTIFNESRTLLIACWYKNMKLIDELNKRIWLLGGCSKSIVAWIVCRRASESCIHYSDCNKRPCGCGWPVQAMLSRKLIGCWAPPPHGASNCNKSWQKVIISHLTE